MCIKRLINLKAIVIILLISLIPYLVQAEENKTIWLEQGKVAPFSGYLITEDKVLNSIETGLLLPIYKEELDRSHKRIEQLESKSEWEKWLYIGIGAGLVLIAGWSLGQVK